MALLRRTGWLDSYTDSRLTHLTGTTYPAPPAGLYVALYRGIPLSDGSDAASLEVVRVGPVTFGAPSLPSGQPAWPVQRYIQPASNLTVTAPGTYNPDLNQEVGITSFGILTQANGGTPVYVGAWTGHVLIGLATTIPASSFRVFSEIA